MQLSVQYMPVDALVPYEHNSKKHPDSQIDQIAASIEQFGNCDPIAIWHDENLSPIIVEGHGRALALKKLGIETAPVISLDHLSDEERRAYSHIHNQTTLTSALDESILGTEIAELPEFDWEAFGFEIIEPNEGEPEELEEPDEPEEVQTRVKPGELWRMGNHYLYCGDSTDPDSVKKVLEPMGGVADLMLTDPPYNISLWDSPEDTLPVLRHRKDRKVIANDSMSEGEYEQFLVDVFSATFNPLRAGGSYYIWHSATFASEVVNALRAIRCIPRQQLVWKKSRISFCRQDYKWSHEACYYGWKPGAAHRWFGPHNLPTVLESEEPPASSAHSPEHPTIKPVSLFAQQIANSTQAGEIVLDPFAGSGTTALACEKLSRRAALIELEPSYCDVILARWEQMTGEKAEKC